MANVDGNALVKALRAEVMELVHSEDLNEEAVHVECIFELIRGIENKLNAQHEEIYRWRKSYAEKKAAEIEARLSENSK